MSMKAKKERIDVLLVERGLIETREKAKRAVMAGLVYSNEERLDKPGEKISSDAPLQIKGNVLPYVSRGGLKLEKALKVFDLKIKDKIMIDIGSSTGGLPIVPCKTGRSCLMHLMSVIISWPGSCAKMSESSSWNGQTSAM